MSHITDTVTISVVFYCVAVVTATIAAVTAYYAEVNDKPKLAKRIILNAVLLCAILILAAQFLINL